MLIEITVELDSYIAHPYWPEMERLVNIQKESGMARARSSANRRKALEEFLRSESMTLQDYDDLEKLATRPFYLDDAGVIQIPKKQVDGLLVAMCDTARSAMRPCPADMVRTVLRASAWSTQTKPEEARTWTRYAVVTSGTGAKLSNQRGLRANQYIGGRPPGD